MCVSLSVRLERTIIYLRLATLVYAMGPCIFHNFMLYIVAKVAKS